MAAGDFYFAINATFRFFQDRYGQAALETYWRALGKGYYRPLIERFRSEGLPGVESYWRDFFEKEPGGAVSVSRKDNVVEIDVRDRAHLVVDEPAKHQVVRQRIDVGKSDQVADDRTDGGSSPASRRERGGEAIHTADLDRDLPRQL